LLISGDTVRGGRDERPGGTGADLQDPDRDAALLAQFLSDRDLECPRCGYGLQGSAGPRCPECGCPLRLALEGASRWPVIHATVASLLVPLASVAAWLPLMLTYGVRSWAVAADLWTRVLWVEAGLAYLILIVVFSRAILSRRPDRDTRLVRSLLRILSGFCAVFVLTAFLLWV
jgi:hypothetical protein